jgi:hypothetical protein
MEGRSHDSSLPDGDGVCTFGGEDFHVGANALDFWSADEDHLEGGVFPFLVSVFICSVEIFSVEILSVELEQFAFADGAVELAAVGVAADGDIEGAEA